MAVVALGLGGGLTIERRRAEFRRRADCHFGEQFEFPLATPSFRCVNATCAEFQAEGCPTTATGYHLHPVRGLLTRADRAWLDYHDGMFAKYDEAARWPWLPVAHDPPAPPKPPPYESRRVRPVSVDRAPPPALE